MKEKETNTKKQGKIKTVDQVISKVIKSSPDLDITRQDWVAAGLRVTKDGLIYIDPFADIKRNDI